MGVRCHAQLPSYVSSNNLAQRFSNHFEKKVSDIQQSIAHRSGDRSYAIAAAFSVDTAFRGIELTRFTGVSDSDVSKLIADSPCKSCGLDPLPTCSYDHSNNKHLPRKFNCTWRIQTGGRATCPKKGYAWWRCFMQLPSNFELAVFVKACWKSDRSALQTQHSAVDSATSADCVMKCGVPQGSVLEPILYCIHTRPIGDIVAWHSLQYHCYADDTQIYMAVKHNQPITEAITKIEQCLTEVTDWYGKN